MEAQLEFDALFSEFAQLSAQVNQYISAVDEYKQAKTFLAAERTDNLGTIENRDSEPRFLNSNHSNPHHRVTGLSYSAYGQQDELRGPSQDDLHETAQEASGMDEINKFAQLIQRYEQLGRDGRYYAATGKSEVAKEHREEKIVLLTYEPAKSPIMEVKESIIEYSSEYAALNGYFQSNYAELINEYPSAEDESQASYNDVEQAGQAAEDYVGGDLVSSGENQLSTNYRTNQNLALISIDKGSMEDHESQQQAQTADSANSSEKVASSGYSAELQLLLSRIAENEAFLRQNGLEPELSRKTEQKGAADHYYSAEQLYAYEPVYLHEKWQNSAEEVLHSAVQAYSSADPDLFDEPEVQCLVARSKPSKATSSPRPAVTDEIKRESWPKRDFGGEADFKNKSNFESQSNLYEHPTRGPTISAFSRDLVYFPPEDPSESDLAAFRASLLALFSAGRPAGEASAEVVKLLSAARESLPTPPGLYYLLQLTSPDTSFSAVRKRFAESTAGAPKTELSFALISSLLSAEECLMDALADAFLAYSQVTGYYYIVPRQLFESSKHELGRFFTKHCPKLALGATAGLEHAQALFKELGLAAVLPLGRAAVCFTRAAYAYARYIADFAAVNTARGVPNVQRRESLNFDFLACLNQSVLADAGQTKPMRAQGCRLCFFGFLCYLYMLSEAVYAELNERTGRPRNSENAALQRSQSAECRDISSNAQESRLPSDGLHYPAGSQGWNQTGDAAANSGDWAGNYGNLPGKQLSQQPAAFTATKSALAASISSRKAQFSQPVFASLEAPLTTSNFSLFAAWRGMLRFGLFIDQVVLVKARRAGYMEFQKDFCLNFYSCCGEYSGGRQDFKSLGDLQADQTGLNSLWFQNRQFYPHIAYYCTYSLHHAAPPQFLPPAARALLRRYEPRLRALFARVCGYAANLGGIQQLLRGYLIYKLLPAGFFYGFVILNYSALSDTFAPVLSYQETICLIAAAADRALSAGVYAQYFGTAEERLAYALRELLGGAR